MILLLEEYVKMNYSSPEKRVPPLNNPPTEKSADADADVTIKINKPSGNVSDRSEKGVSKGGRERVKPAEALLKCQMCGHLQKLVFRAGKPPEWHRCIWCNELQPTDGYKVVAYGLGLPRVLSPQEVETRRVQREVNPQR